MKRVSGILMPIFSLPSKYGIGDFGEESYKFIDFLAKSNQKIWQILPLVQTGYGNSPYSSICSKSFSPYYISPKGLFNSGLIDEEDLKSAENDSKYIDYGFLYKNRISLLRKAFLRFNILDAEFQKFILRKEYLDYAIFMANKEKTDHKPFYEWEKGLKRREKKAINQFVKENLKEVLFWQFVQYLAKKEWKALKKYANKNKVKILGDMPLYVALDSVDVWCNSKLFKIDKNFKPKKVAGVPPDYFCEDGQLWGNPVYNYKEHKKDGFKWWIKRIKDCLSCFDLVRIDHFRGLDRYYEIDFGRENAKVGKWVKVPSKKLIDALHKKVNPKKIIAEDLGIIDDSVRKLLKYTSYPGMKILEFAFNGEENNLYLPQNVEENSVCFTGTHDNDTLFGFFNNLSDWDRNNLYWGVKKSLAHFNIDGKLEDNVSICKSIIELGFASKSKIFIMPMQDLLLLDSEYRINEPGKIKEQNWAVRLSKDDISDLQIELLNYLTKKYKRN